MNKDEVEQLIKTLIRDCRHYLLTESEVLAFRVREGPGTLKEGVKGFGDRIE